MLNSRTKQQVAIAAYAVVHMVNIEASIVALKDEDLLDLADSCEAKAGSALRRLASTEMVKYDLSL